MCRSRAKLDVDSSSNIHEPRATFMVPAAVLGDRHLCTPCLVQFEEIRVFPLPPKSIAHSMIKNMFTGKGRKPSMSECNGHLEDASSKAIGGCPQHQLKGLSLRSHRNLLRMRASALMSVFQDAFLALQTTIVVSQCCHWINFSSPEKTVFPPLYLLNRGSLRLKR